jgi:RNA polymerase sigma-70 factor (ECF subfamily)
MASHPFETWARGRSGGVFATTHWSTVRKAGVSQGEDCARALNTLCQGYWYPLYAYVRRLGHSPEDSQDLTQSFFAYLLDKRLLGRADPGSGRFRSFLLGSLKKFIANEWRRQNALKRGGGMTVSFDAQTAEERYAVEPVDEANPQLIYDQAWAVAVLDQAFALLAAEHSQAGKAPLFEALKPCLQGDRTRASYPEIGARFGMSEGAVKVAVYRLRQRYRELLRSVVANTVDDPLEVDQELRHLVDILGR